MDLKMRQRLKSVGNQILVILVSILSVYYTATFWIDSGGAWWVLTVLVVVWELAKFLRSDDVAEKIVRFSPRVADWLDSALTVALMMVLVGGSAGFTVGGLLVAAGREADQVAEQARIGSARIPALNREIANLEGKIGGLKAEIDGHAARGWDTRALRADLDRAIARQAAAAIELDALNGADTLRNRGNAGASPRFVAIAGGLEVVGVNLPQVGTLTPAATLERVWSLFCGVMFEVMAISLLIQTYLRASLRWAVVESAPPKPQPIPTQTPATPTTGGEPEEEVYQWVREQVRAGFVIPTVEGVGWAARVNPEIAAQIVTRLGDEHPQNPTVETPVSGFEPENAPTQIGAGGAPKKTAPASELSRGGGVRRVSKSWSDADEARLIRALRGFESGELSSASETALKRFVGGGSQAVERVRMRLVEIGVADWEGKRCVIRPLHQWPGEYRQIEIYRRG